MKILHLLLLVKCLMCLFPGISVALDTLDVSRTLSGNDTLVSGDGTFELGFFSPGNSMKLYLGIWYKDVPVRTVVWVANRDKPINGSSGSLRIVMEGKFILSSQNSRLAIWSTNSTRQAHNPVLQLLDTGNLVLRNGGDENPDSYLWQSFDYPTDTLLPDMKIGWNSRTGVDMRLSSWKSPDDPSTGDFTWRITHTSYPETLAYKGSSKYFRGGPWNGLHFSGAIQQLPNPTFSYNFTFSADEAFYVYHVNDKSLARLVLNQTNSHMEKYIWSNSSQSWRIILEVPKDYCDSYGLCGAYGKCLSNAMGYCECLTRFMPKDPDKWKSSDWSQGCVRNKPLDCKTDGFIEYPRLKLPDTTYSLVDKGLDIKECRERCLRNCSCTAYTNSDIRGTGSGCAMWFGNLIDIREFPPESGQTLFIRLPASELDLTGKRQANFWIVVIVVLSFAVIAGMLTAACYIYKSRMKSKGVQERAEELPQGQDVEGPEDDFELPTFDLAKIVKSTDSFSVKNKLGEGGFGSVYKGVLEDGQEIAVKRLSSSSRQGIREFKNEVILIAKLQHRNLVKLLGCCIEQEEKMLIYEYMPNKSLDAFLFDETRSKELDWGKRFNIIHGVARGILYLHQDSRLRIIHRDLKASNVLLDKEMHPKISDFGMARIFGGDQSECNTNRVVGTYGYMAPEYAIDGLFSVKSDVFSFGILVLETISGKRNRGFYHAENSLAGQAWKLYNAGKASELIDPSLVDTCTITEVLRCTHIGLLCLQEHPEDRPSMSSVVVMLSSDTPLPVPKQPGFLSGKTFAESSSSSKLESCSVNDITVTLLDAR